MIAATRFNTSDLFDYSNVQKNTSHLIILSHFMNLNYCNEMSVLVRMLISQIEHGLEKADARQRCANENAVLPSIHSEEVGLTFFHDYTQNKLI